MPSRGDGLVDCFLWRLATDEGHAATVRICIALKVCGSFHEPPRILSLTRFSSLLLSVRRWGQSRPGRCVRVFATEGDYSESVSVAHRAALGRSRSPLSGGARPPSSPIGGQEFCLEIVSAAVSPPRSRGTESARTPCSSHQSSYVLSLSGHSSPVWPTDSCLRRHRGSSDTQEPILPCTAPQGPLRFQQVSMSSLRCLVGEFEKSRGPRSECLCHSGTARVSLRVRDISRIVIHSWCRWRPDQRRCRPHSASSGHRDPYPNH